MSTPLPPHSQSDTTITVPFPVSLALHPIINGITQLKFLGSASNETWADIVELVRICRMAWDPTVNVKATLDDWTRLTFGLDADSIGMDRTVWNGTGFAGQYPPEVARRYEGIDTTPDDLLLWFHHVPYTHRVHSVKIRKGDTIKIVGKPNGPELAPIDYIVLLPKGIID
ncbi:hypothetical protein VC83_03215 [Pseudogymnoascus destructans]|uniref:Glycosyl hydrolase family 67 C-terminal domain-containing protein n=1 Tax=Pseudogymnoascus destructans TaxID=655981 RepID=A0A177ADP0_9PEZI|nr:uncharacterized protein VC83_03215 [Pseudogymnoascus destructans]OAF60187.1 hypothetical protein VC83_03215 [Pseudogymnoascus destructans]